MRGYDWLIVAAAILFFGARLMTNFVFGFYTNAAETVQQAAAVVTVMEANPIVAWAINAGTISHIFSTFMVPVMFIGFWMILRKITRSDDVRTIYATLFLFVAFNDFLIDSAIALGIMAQNWV